ncbi:prohibitin family protein [Runella sp. SP2]|uniref:prohibitin family protein n=1 Tax=Runella sp. SP2 TaxID=2268026 RepID=UPI000F0755AC|nr:prohibitin family protein [Runella sp. SP2]AYQ36287.1 prohibitin family protein [Runella sp. SP2]
MKTLNHAAVFFILACLTSSCVVIRQGEVGVQRKLGKIQPTPVNEGLKGFNPFVTRIIKVPTRTMNIEVRSPLPSKEGLTVQSDVSILYRVVGKDAPQIIEKLGQNYEQVVMLPVFRSAVADVSSRFYAKDMHTGQRAAIESAIKEQMMLQLQNRGFVVEAVLLKSIVLPTGLAKAIEDKLEAEQDAQRMQFVLDKERQEAQRRIIEAEGIRDAQKIINEGLTPMLIQFKSIEAFNKLSTSPNSKVIITNGTTPMLIGPDKIQ